MIHIQCPLFLANGKNVNVYFADACRTLVFIILLVNVPLLAVPLGIEIMYVV